MSEAELADVLDVHFRGSFGLAKAAWGQLREQGYGRIVLTTSVTGLFGNFGPANYASANPDATAEDIAAHRTEIMDTSSWSVPSQAVQLPE